MATPATRYLTSMLPPRPLTTRQYQPTRGQTAASAWISDLLARLRIDAPARAVPHTLAHAIGTKVQVRLFSGQDREGLQV